MPINHGQRCYAIGVVPSTPFVLWDYDLDTNETRTDAFAWLRQYAIEQAEYGTHRHWCIRWTKNGYHLIIEAENWDWVQGKLEELYKLTSKQSIMNCRRQRIRVSPKWNVLNGIELSPTPTITEGCIHKTEYWNDLRHGKLEFYATYERGLDTGFKLLPEHTGE